MVPVAWLDCQIPRPAIKQPMIYLDNAATSFPKPQACFKRGLRDYLTFGASPGRGGYDAARQAHQAVDAVRRKIAAFFGGNDFVVCFGNNATDALNILLQGLIHEAGSHVVSSRLEHNSVLRPLHHLRALGRCEFDLVPFNGNGVVEPDAVAHALRPSTRLVILNHASNVLGSVQPVEAIGRLCNEHQIPLILDVSQSGGQVPVNMCAWNVSAIAFTGHKSLLGPSGVGGLVIDPALNVLPSRWGGTGTDSESLFQSENYPERLESGTINLLGIMTLGRCIDYLQSSEGQAAAVRERQLYERLLSELLDLDGMSVDCPGFGPDRIPLVSCHLAGWPSHDVGTVLDGDYDIAVRTGLHCAPLVHRDLGHGEHGSVRISLGHYTTNSDIDAIINAFRDMLS